MTLSGPQIDPCDHCNDVTEIKPAGGMMLCSGCRAIRCPRCAAFRGAFNDEWGIYVCGMCGDSYVYRGD